MELVIFISLCFVLVFLRFTKVDSLVIHAGERYDFIVNAGQEISSYWIRLHGLMDCGPKRVFQAAILRYHGALETEPDAILTYENTNRLGKVSEI